MHFKYSSILVQVYVSFMYGMFMPILFLVSLLGMFNMYVVERLSLAYIFRQPPHFDATINSRAIKILKTAPMLMLLLDIGQWVIDKFSSMNLTLMYHILTHLVTQTIAYSKNGPVVMEEV